MKLTLKTMSGRIPKYATEGASGMDLCAYLDKPVVMRPMQRALIPTGLFLEIPAGYEGQIRARSGLAIKKGIGLINGVGTIDSDYRGEVKVPLINFGDEDFTVSDGDRIAQLIIASYEKVEIVVTDEISDTARGSGGFGHTGIRDN